MIPKKYCESSPFSGELSLVFEDYSSPEHLKLITVGGEQRLASQEELAIFSGPYILVPTDGNGQRGSSFRFLVYTETD